MSAIVVEHLTKRYHQYEDQARLLRLPRRGMGRARTEVAALDDVSFTVEPGATLGVIGQNGSGKTTLLRILSGVSGPSSGRVRVSGSIAPLIGVGVGFNPELTGRENVHVNGRLLGMTRDEVEGRFDEIVEFSEVEEFIDAPVKFYSSGMFLRLAFAVAIHTNPSIMLVDEILAVGDVGFQAKCFERMRILQSSGTTIVIVTHNLQMLERLTRRTIVLERGRMMHDGSTEEALDVYHGLLQQRREEHQDTAAVTWQQRIDAKRAGGGRVDVTVTLLDDDGQETSQVRGREPCTIRIDATFEEEIAGPVVGISIERAGIGLLYMAASDPKAYDGVHGPDRPLSATIRIPHLSLMGGTHLLRGVIRRPAGDVEMATSPPRLFHVSSLALGAGTVDLDPSIEVEGTRVPVARPYLLETEDRGQA